MASQIPARGQTQGIRISPQSRYVVLVDPVRSRRSSARTPRADSALDLVVVVRLAEDRGRYQQPAGDQPRNRIEMLIASARSCRVPASRAGSIALHVCDEQARQPGTRQETEQRS